MSEQTGHRPLVVFTSLAVAGAGLVAASSGFELVYRHASPGALATGTVLLAAGLVVSLVHLGQTRRAPLALRGAGRSALSNEVLLAGLALAAAALSAGLDLAGAHAPGAVFTAGAINALLLVSIGLVYRVRGQRTWGGFSALTPLSGGLAFGAIAVQSMTVAGGAFRGTLVLLAIDALVFLRRWRDVAGIALPDAVPAQAVFARRDQLLGARFFLLDVVPGLLLVAWPTPLAAVVAAAGLCVDRVAFYGLALPHTTEHEIAGVEEQIEALDHPARR
jgi:DMSO reductase anchor subunit